ncbi:MAG: YccF domain-containing protein [Cyclobacteriaceae bacterium]|nr:YccF domain-containing protein [Cyclobacteriaceae bacterium HetDA_MAG_MS6]
MKTLGNIVWLVFGGILVAIEYLVASLLLFISIIGIPFGIQTLKMAGLALWPFGKEVKAGERASGCLWIIMNIVWILIGGFWISITHLVFAILLAITIIGIPFAQQHVKLAALALTPFGRDIISKP